ncbi:leucine-rich repeat-containing protein 15-like isoform X2 [Pseudomyrmex gracilis]|uniref:leucine-rich repeat-containing protein 15-like isoform X2 n=1 Tax=Pseudomyrmex gracilis TaxID=219809 RepID=UPI000994C46B|nr:leucine-rich repeat-containing protein 15-like isoform X2 [Pseudomyrmex gracilis]
MMKDNGYFRLQAASSVRCTLSTMCYLVQTVRDMTDISSRIHCTIVLILLCDMRTCTPISHACITASMRAATDSERSTVSASLPIFEEMENRLSSLERRLRTVEQPVWQISSKEEDWEICAEGPCKCVPELKSVSCWRYDLLDLPPTQVVPTDVLRLDLGNNQLTALNKNTFGNMTLLQHLDLSSNLIEHLTSNLFLSLHSVANVRLSSNLLKEMQYNQFFGLRNLRILLCTLPEGLFLSNTLLVLLDLSFNRISLLPSATFRGLGNLEELLLGKNRLVKLPVLIFQDMNRLKRLALEENRLKELPNDVFQDLTSLKELDMRDNRLTELPKGLLSTLVKLEILELSSNRISRIDARAFYGMTTLRELRLGHNHIKHLPLGLFDHATSLERLILYGNRIEILIRGVFRSLYNLTSLFLQSNRLKILQSGVFDDTPNLQKLQLESNDLSFLPAGSMDAISSIQQIRLSRNPWHCDCRASYVASWLRKRFASYANLTNALQIQKMLIVTGNWSVWEFGAGATCRGPGILGGQSLLRLTFHELCEGQWASMKGIVPRLPLDIIASSVIPHATERNKI